jgi:hypothetical protein
MIFHKLLIHPKESSGIVKSFRKENLTVRERERERERERGRKSRKLLIIFN